MHLHSLPRFRKNDLEPELQIIAISEMSYQSNSNKITREMENEMYGWMPPRVIEIPP
jgi:hypothetical protein